MVVQPISPKLTKYSYAYWRVQVLFLVGYELQDHLTGFVPCQHLLLWLKMTWEQIWLNRQNLIELVEIREPINELVACVDN